MATREADKLIRSEKVAEFYDVTPKTAERWADAGRIPRPVVKRKRYTAWSMAEIVAHVEHLKQSQTAEAAK